MAVVGCRDAHTVAPPPTALGALAARQDTVVTRAQCLALGATPKWVSVQVSSGRWQRLHSGVMVTHSGPVPWRARARAALLYAGPGAALSHDSAGFLHSFVPRPSRLVHVSIPEARRVAPTPGVVIRRRRHLEVAPGTFAVVSPGQTVLDMLHETASDDDAIGLICAAVRAGTLPEQILQALEGRARVRRRSLLADLIAAAACGVESPLELRYHRAVESRHRLPAARLQVRHVLDGRWVRADRVYEGLRVRVELDGELAHPGGRTDSDAWRDNAVMIERAELTLRYRWRHVCVTPCETAAQVRAALRSRGWTGDTRRCGPTCTIG